MHFANARQHTHQTAKTTHFLQLTDLRQKIIHIELAFCHTTSHALGFFGFDRFRGFFDKRNHIPHIKDASGKTSRVKFFQRVLFFANTSKLDRTASHMPHRQRGTPACITIKAGQRNTGYANRLMKCFGCIDRILTGHRVGNQQNFVRIGNFLNFAQLCHQRFINAQPAGSIQNQHIIGLQLGHLQRTFRNLRRGFGIGFGQDADLCLFAQKPQLFAGCRARHIK